MPAAWFALKRSLHCKLQPSDVHDPKVKSNLGNIQTRKTCRSGCSRSIANLKDVIHGSKRHMERGPSSSSPRSIGSSEFLNPLTHEVVLSHATCELKIAGFGASQEGNGGGSSFVGTLRTRTPGPSRALSTPVRKTPSSLSRRSASGFGGIPSHPRTPSRAVSHASSTSTCQKCREQFSKWEAVEAHHLSKHAVTELVEGDSSRKIVEIICRTSWLKSDNNCWRVERILKVHNTQKTLSQFEDHREMVKLRASKLSKKHPRCLADGNELLRFHGTSVECSLGLDGYSGICMSDKCCACRILRDGFFINKELNGGLRVGVFTASTTGRALETVQVCDGEPYMRKALIVCRVIAGRVHRPLENFEELAGQTGFDSVAGKMGLYSNVEELYLLNPRALLPCFVVICKP